MKNHYSLHQNPCSQERTSDAAFYRTTAGIGMKNVTVMLKIRILLDTKKLKLVVWDIHRQ